MQEIMRCYIAGIDAPARERIIAEVSPVFGGVSLFDTTGGWIDPDTDELVAEPSMIVEVVAPPHTRHTFQYIMAAIGREQQQSALLFTYTPVEHVMLTL